MPRFVEIPSEQKGEKTFILLEQIIEKNIGKLFVNYEIESVFPYRIMRNADLSIEEDEAADLLIEIERQLKKRQSVWKLKQAWTNVCSKNCVRS